MTHFEPDDVVGYALARETDLARVVEISNWAARATAANFATEPEPLEKWVDAWRATHALHPWIVATLNGRVVAFAKTSPHRARGAYKWTAEVSVYVDAEHHGRGFGRTLYGLLIPVLRRQGYVTLLAGITLGNPASERLHAAAGFTRCGTYHRVGWKHGAWHDVGQWEMQLQPAAALPSELRTVEEAWTEQTRTREP